MSLSLQETARRLRSGEEDLHAYLRALCDHIEAREPTLEALLPEQGRRERLQAEAEALLQRYPDPESRPPLFGVPVGVKDIFRVDGFPTRCGSALPPDLFEGPEASLVTRLKAAGALVLGKTVTTEFAYFEPGPTRNPHHPEHTPGGSSSGSAAAVAAGYCPLALGSQTVGSVIRPAAFCGVAGFKPGYEVLPRDGVVPYAPSLDHAGFFVADPADLPLPLEVLSSREAAARPLRTAAVPEGPYLRQAPDEALEALERQVSRLEAAGLKVLRVAALPEIAAINHRHNRLAAAELAEVHRDWFPRYEALYRPRTAAWIREGLTVPAEEVEAARAGRLALRRELCDTMAAQGIDVWVCPPALGTAPQGLASTGDPVMNLPWTYAGLPAAVVPAGNAANGPPLGLQLVGRWGEDGALAGFAAWAGGVLAGA